MSKPSHTNSQNEKLFDRPFSSYLAAVFINAFNDNAFKIILILFLLRGIGDEGGTGVSGKALEIFTIPFLIFASWAGIFADRYSKRTVFVVMQAYGVFAMLLAAAAFALDSLPLMLGALFWAGTQSAFYSPAKFGLLPEALPREKLSRANGVLMAATFVAIILGTAYSGVALWLFDGDATASTLLCAGFALVAFFLSLAIWRPEPANQKKKFSWNPFADVFRTLKLTLPNRSIGAPMAGLAFFWFLGAIVQGALPVHARQILFDGLSNADIELRTSILMAIVALGIGVGSLLGGRLSGRKVELGLVPFGALGTSIFLIDYGLHAATVVRAGIDLLFIGFFAGFFVIPLQAAVQQRAPDDKKGAVLAASSFLTFTGILIAARSLSLAETAGLSAGEIFIVLGGLSLLVGVLLCVWLAEFAFRFLTWLLTHTVYKIRIRGAENIPDRGPALIIANHVSFVDALLIGACVQRFIRFLMLKDYYHHPLFNGVCRLMKAIPIATGERRSTKESLRLAIAALKEGHVVCIFAEGQITRTGQLLPFRKGLEIVAREANVPIIPVHLDGVWGSIFSFQGGRIIWKKPRQIPYPVTVSFGAPMSPMSTSYDVRQAVAELGAESMEETIPTKGSLLDAFLRSCRRRWFRLAAVDSTGLKLAYGQLLAVSTLLSRRLHKESPQGENYVGIVLPTVVAAAIANIAVDISGKIPVNLNFTASEESLKSSIERCQITRVITSRKFVEKIDLKIKGANLLYIEDYLKAIPKAKILATWCGLFLTPLFLLRRFVPVKRKKAHSTATVIFSSGSTGLPKGVVLTQANIRSNIEGLAQIFDIRPSDRVVGVLPFFHSFGFTVTIWFPFVVGCSAVYHPNPLDPKTIGKLTQKFSGTILLATPTFSASYIRRIDPEQFASLRFTVVGAEKLQPDLATKWKDKYGSPLLEGYGTTELSPVVSVNLPSRTKLGSIGHPIPGVAVRITDPDTGRILGPGEEGMLEVKGPNVMYEYLDDPEKTAAVMKDGWYTTGDIAQLDRDGYIRITGRLSRFSKIGGEMVPHGKIEEELQRIAGATGPEIAVTGVKDPSRGERLVVLHALELEPEKLIEELRESGIPNLWIPRKGDFHKVDELPLLGTGKLDLRGLQSIAEKLTERS